MKVDLRADVRAYITGMRVANETETIALVKRLGYAPNDWRGIWKLVPQPIVYRGHGIVILREVIYRPRTTKAIYFRGRALTRLVIRREPRT